MQLPEKSSGNNMITRQLPMGAGHCPWGGYTDRIVCNIHGEEHLASRYRAMLRPGAFGKFGNLPATLETCQYWETFLDRATCCFATFGKFGIFASHSGNLPVLGNFSRWSPLSFYNIWQAAKISWHAANSTSPDPLRP